MLACRKRQFFWNFLHSITWIWCFNKYRETSKLVVVTTKHNLNKLFSRPTVQNQLTDFPSKFMGVRSLAAAVRRKGRRKWTVVGFPTVANSDGWLWWWWDTNFLDHCQVQDESKILACDATPNERSMAFKTLPSKVSTTLWFFFGGILKKFDFLLFKFQISLQCSNLYP